MFHVFLTSLTTPYKIMQFKDKDLLNKILKKTKRILKRHILRSLMNYHRFRCSSPKRTLKVIMIKISMSKRTMELKILNR